MILSHPSVTSFLFCCESLWHGPPCVFAGRVLCYSPRFTLRYVISDIAQYCISNSRATIFSGPLSHYIYLPVPGFILCVPRRVCYPSEDTVADEVVKPTSFLACDPSMESRDLDTTFKGCS